MAESAGRKLDTAASGDSTNEPSADHTKGQTAEDAGPALTTRTSQDGMADKTKAEQLLALGIECLEKDEDHEALAHLTAAIALDSTNPLLFINRAAAYARLKNYDDAMEDAETAVEMRSNWPEAYLRKGAIYLAEWRHRLAFCAFRCGLNLDPGNERLGRALFESKTRMQNTKNGTRYPKPPTHPLMDKSTHEKLRRNSFTRDFMTDTEFVDTLDRMRRDHDLWVELQNSDDKRYMVASTVAMAFDVNAVDTDYSDTLDEEKHSEDLKRFNYPYVQKFEAVREVVIPANPPAAPPEESNRTPPLPAVKYPRGCEIDGAPVFAGLDMRLPSFFSESSFW